MSRNKYIGGSDCAAVLGHSRWGTPLSVWAEKTGQYIKPEVDSEATELGRELEDYVAKRFCRKTGKEVKRSEGPFFHQDYEFLGGNVDRLIVGEDAGLECKTASPWKSKEWEGDEIPPEYLIQCYHYMMVTGFRKWYLAVLIGNQAFHVREIFWDDRIMADMKRRLVTFWMEFVVTEIMPLNVTYKDTDTIDALFPAAKEGEVIQLEDSANILVENLTSYKQDLKQLEHQIEEAENQLKILLRESERGRTSLYEIGWKNSKWSGLDGKALKVEMPDIHKRFYRSKPIRKFGYKKHGEDE